MTPSFPNDTFSVISADPPWSYKQRWGNMESHGSATAHYSTMSLDQIKALPVPDIAEPNCALFLWGVNPKVREALEVIDYWGFRYVTKAFCWIKVYQSLRDYCGLGFYTRSGNEDCWLAVRGSMPPVSRRERQVIITEQGWDPDIEWHTETFKAVVRKHSQKPDAVQDRIDALYPEAKKIELFARRARPGWAAWGNEAPETTADMTDEQILALTDEEFEAIYGGSQG